MDRLALSKSMSQECASFERALFGLPEINLTELTDEIFAAPLEQTLEAIFHSSLGTSISDHPLQGRKIPREHVEAAISGMAEYIMTAIGNGSAALRELLARMSQDRILLSQPGRPLYGENPIDQKINISPRKSDAHNNGRVVRILSAGTHRWVYKPRASSAEQLLQFILQSLTQLGVLRSTNSMWSINKDGYGWTEFVNRAPTTTITDTEEYYYNAGSLYAIAALLGATDLHYENIVAKGTQPCVVDAEGLMQPSRSGTPERFAFLALQTGLAGLHGTKNMQFDDWSGVTFVHRPAVGTQVGFVDDGETTITVFKKHRTILPHTNYPLMRNLTQEERAQCFSSFVNGFLCLRKKVVRARLDINCIFEEAFELFDDYKARVFLRPTLSYINMRQHLVLRTSSNVASSDHKQNNNYDRILESEKAQLRRGDIPQFFVPHATRNLVDGGGKEIISNYYSHSPQDAQFARLKSDSDFMCLADIDIQSIICEIYRRSQR